MKMMMVSSCLDGEGSSQSPPAAAAAGMGFTAAAVRLELTRGQERLAQLQALLLLPQEDRSPAAGSLVRDALGSITRALSVLDRQPRKEAAEAPANPAGVAKDEQESKKKRNSQQPRRSGYRRRFQPYKLRKSVSKTMEDGYTWRKYGQKEIHGSKFPRNYFRCTHKNDRLCQATRQVQCSEEDPSMFVITYVGEHTCANMFYPSDESSPLEQGTSTCIIDFQLNTSSTVTSTPFQECADEEALSSLTVGGSSELLPMFADLGGSAQMEHFAALAADHCDVTSGLMQYSSASGMGMDFLHNEAFDMYQWCV